MPFVYVTKHIPKPAREQGTDAYRLYRSRAASIGRQVARYRCPLCGSIIGGHGGSMAHEGSKRCLKAQYARSTNPASSPSLPLVSSQEPK